MSNNPLFKELLLTYHRAANSLNIAYSESPESLAITYIEFLERNKGIKEMVKFSTIDLNAIEAQILVEFEKIYAEVS